MLRSPRRPSATSGCMTSSISTWRTAFCGLCKPLDEDVRERSPQNDKSQCLNHSGLSLRDLRRRGTRWVCDSCDLNSGTHQYEHRSVGPSPGRGFDVGADNWCVLHVIAPAESRETV